MSEAFRPVDNFDESGQPKLVVISTPSCANCVSVENLLNSKKLDYKKYVIGESMTQDDFVGLAATTRSFPVVFFGEREIVGQGDLLKHVAAVK